MAEGHGRHSLHQAARLGNVEECKRLVEAFDERSVESAAVTNSTSALNRVTRLGLAVVKRSKAGSVASDSSASFIDAQDAESYTALHYAVKNNHKDVAQILLAAGASIRVHADEGITVFHLAAKFGDESLVKMLALCAEESGEGSMMREPDHYGTTPLHYACWRGNLAVIDTLVAASRGDVDVTDSAGVTPLHYAAEYNYVDIASKLIVAGARLRAKDNSDSTPLMFAAAAGSVDMLELLFFTAQQRQEAAGKVDGAQLGDDAMLVETLLRDRDADGHAVSHLSAQSGEVEALKVCLKYGAWVDHKAKFTARTLNHIAARHGNTEVLKLALEAGCPVLAKDNRGQLALHRAALHGHLEAVKVLCGAGEGAGLLGLNQADVDGRTPLMLAASRAHTEVMEELLAKKALYGRQDKLGKTVLHHAVESESISAVRVLLKSSTLKQQQIQELMASVDKYDSTALHRAAAIGMLEAVQLFHDCGANMTVKDDAEQTPLHMAVRSGHSETVQALITSDSSLVAAEDDTGQTPLHYACANGHGGICLLLLQNGAVIDAEDERHQTPLMEAAIAGHVNCAGHLLDLDAAKNRVDKNNMSALMYACQNCHDETAFLLLSRDCYLGQQNAWGRNALDLAIESGHNGIVDAILAHHQWSLAMSTRIRPDHVKNSNGISVLGMTPFKRMLIKMPEAALKVLNQCTSTNGVSFDNAELEVVYRFDYTQDKESLEDEGLAGPRVLDLMVEHRRGDVASHPVIEHQLRRRWAAVGRYAYYINLVNYLAFVTALTMYVVDNPVLESMQSGYELTSVGNVCQFWILVWAGLAIAEDLFKLVTGGPRAFLQVSELLDIGAYTSALLLVLPLGGPRTLSNWYAGSVAALLAWTDLVVFLQRFGSLGIYVLMLTNTFITVLKVLTVFFIFIVAFALAFFVLLNQQEGFATLATTIGKTSIMMTGEYDFDEIFRGGCDTLTNQTQCGTTAPCLDPACPFPTAAMYPLFLAFVILMNIVLMNLLIGLAVGDIEQIGFDAALTKQLNLLSYVLGVERFLPRPVARYLIPQQETYTFYPNATLPRTAVGKLMKQVLGSSGSVGNPADIGAENELSEIEESILSTRKCRADARQVSDDLKMMGAVAAKQRAALQALARKLRVAVPN